MQLRFKGWKTKTGKLIERTNNLGEEVGYVTVGEHEANRLRKLIGNPGKMTPQYDRF